MQHAFYLGHEVDWSEIEPDLKRALVRAGRLELQSDRRRQQLWIPQIESQLVRWKVFRRGTVIVHEGKARFRDGRIR
jgi:hypothetical protein